MFDYQAGEKYKLTLIMVALAGMMAGGFFTILLSSQSESPRTRQHTARMDDPDLRGDMPTAPPPEAAYSGNGSQGQSQAQGQAAANIADPLAALNLIQEWLPIAWDLSAGTASASQEKAIQYMTDECSQAYRQNVWTEEMAKQINASGIKSSFSASRIAAGTTQADGSVVITVEGKQELQVPNKGVKTRQVKLEYLVKNTGDGLRIAGISESGKS